MTPPPAAAKPPYKGGDTSGEKKTFHDRFTAEFAGRFTADPELKALPSGDVVCNFTIASQRGEEAEFRRCTAFKDAANYIADTFKKGEKVRVFCSNQKSRKFPKEDGTEGLSYDWIVEAVVPMFYKRTEVGTGHETPID